MVPARHRAERRARSQARRLHLEGPRADRGLAQALGRAQPAPQVRSLSLGDVDADVLSQPCRQDAAGGPQEDLATRQGRTAQAVRQGLSMIPARATRAPEVDTVFGQDHASPKKLRHVLARIVGLVLAPLAHQLFELAVLVVGQHDAHAGVEIAAAALGRQALPFETERAAGAGAGRNRKLDGAIERRHAHLAAEHRLIQRDRHFDAQVGAIRLEIGMGRDIDRDQRVAGRTAAKAGIPLPLETNLLAVSEAGRNLDLDLLAVGKVDATRPALGGFRQRDGDLNPDILAAAARGEILELEIRASAARMLAEHALENVVDAAKAAGPAGRAASVGPPGERLEPLEAATRMARMGALEAMETRLALGIDLAAVEGLALRLVTEDFVGGIELGKLHRRLGVVLVGVGMKLLGQLAVGLLDVVLARRPRHPQNLVGVSHPVQLPNAFAIRAGSRESMWYRCCHPATRMCGCGSARQAPAA